MFVPSAPDKRTHVQQRLTDDLIAWMSTVGTEGRPHSVPVWFLFSSDGTFVVYSQPGKRKLDAIRSNPYVALGLDVTSVGKDVVRVEGSASVDNDLPQASEHAQFRAKYADLAANTFGEFDRFSQMFSVPILITPHRKLA
jgi:PPOX class probable F420-dependent enzyme